MDEVCGYGMLWRFVTSWNGVFLRFVLCQYPAPVSANGNDSSLVAELFPSIPPILLSYSPYENQTTASLLPSVILPSSVSRPNDAIPSSTSNALPSTNAPNPRTSHVSQSSDTRFHISSAKLIQRAWSTYDDEVCEGGLESFLRVAVVRAVIFAGERNDGGGLAAAAVGGRCR
ncbi:hypothetical protein CC80DRAFT_111122 [Byssothecium circinans]|uniref:Uncharacterized protein n=1 Tax=Byssothecium circinans TaxID=147558 RepID=A0A6A5TQT4_9PLEO|nr:hypothetical protein CC80DRAFT_111122 [Byssothecium circinans]